MIAVLITPVIKIWQLARLSQQDDTYKNISTVLYNAWAAVMGVGVTKIPRSCHLRTAVFAWICYGFPNSTAFQTFFTTILVDPGLHKQITNLHVLSDSRMNYWVPSGVNTLYDIKDALNNITHKGYECGD